MDFVALAQEVPTRDDRPHLPALTSLRFFLAVAVVFVHYNLMVAPIFPWSRPTNGLGCCMVSAFFTLSGFILTYQYYREGERIDRAAFWRARFARIAPMYWFALLFALSTCPPQIKVDPVWFYQILATNFTFTQALAPNPVVATGLVGPAYTLSIEMFFYLLFPFIVQSVIRRPIIWIACAEAWAFVLPFILVPNFPPISLYINPTGRLVEFVIGIIAGQAYLRRRAQAPSGVAKVEWAALTIFIVYVALMADFLYRENSLIVCAMKFGTAILFAILLFSLSFSKGKLATLLSWAPLVVLGEISYAMYLIHDPLFHIVSKDVVVEPWLNSWASFAIVTAIIAAISFMCFKLIEQPWRRAIVKRHAPRFRALAATSVLLVSLAFWKPIYSAGAEFCIPPQPKISATTFGDSVELERLYCWNTPLGVVVRSHWRPLKNREEAARLAVHLVDKNGAIISQMDHDLLAPNFTQSEKTDEFIIPAKRASNVAFIALAVYRDPTKSLLLKTDGNTDWGNHRLLISIPI